MKFPAGIQAISAISGGDHSDPNKPPDGALVTMYEHRQTGCMHLCCDTHGVWTREKTAGKRDWEPWQQFDEPPIENIQSEAARYLLAKQKADKT